MGDSFKGDIERPFNITECLTNLNETIDKIYKTETSIINAHKKCYDLRWYQHAWFNSVRGNVTLPNEC